MDDELVEGQAPGSFADILAALTDTGTEVERFIIVDGEAVFVANE